MSDNSNGGGLESLLLGIGFGGLLLAPFYLMHRLGATFVAGAGALLLTVLAIFSDDLVAAVSEAEPCGMCMTAALDRMILEWDKIGWWPIAGTMWAAFVLLLVANTLLNRPGTEPNP